MGGSGGGGQGSAPPFLAHVVGLLNIGSKVDPPHGPPPPLPLGSYKAEQALNWWNAKDIRPVKASA